MAYSNQTTNYNLPQYSADDKPKYLSDFNQAMSNIDTVIKGVDDKATSAQETAQSANTTANQANSTAGTANTNADSALDKATENSHILYSFFDGFNNINEWLPPKE